MTERSRKILADLKTSQFGVALQEYLDEQFEIINDVQACESWDDVLGRKRTLRTIESLFSFMKSPRTEEKIKNEYI